jgi:ribosomal protein S18 acetylase RimI-like enzyme
LVPFPPPDTYRIERAGPADAADLFRLERLVFDPEMAFHLKQLQSLLRNPRASIWMVRGSEGLLGQLIVLRKTNRAGTLARIYSLAVHPQWRGQGLARHLLEVGLHQLWSEGVYRVILEVECEALPARRLYETFGFSVVSELKDYYAAGRHGLKMELMRP